MTKKKILLLVILIIIAALVITAALLLFVPADVSAIEGVTLQAESVTPEGMTYYITNRSSGELTYSPKYTLEKKGLFGWRKLLPNSLGAYWNAVAYYVNSDSQARQDVNWSYLYGTLSPGTYRMVIPLINHDRNIAVEFTIPRN